MSQKQGGVPDNFDLINFFRKNELHNPSLVADTYEGGEFKKMLIATNIKIIRMLHAMRPLLKIIKCLFQNK
jgi:hypothetical protein